MYNITFNNNYILKIYDSTENKSTGSLTLQISPADYSLTEVINLFNNLTKDDLKKIVKTTSTAMYSTTYENYTDIVSRSVDKVTVLVEKTSEVPTIGEDGQETTTIVTTNEPQEIELIVVVLKYEDPTKIIVEKLNNQINPTIDIETCSLEELKAWQKNIINSECTTNIEYGVDVSLSDGNQYHFSYKIVDQINYAEMYQEIEYDGYTMLPYHPDNGDCILYTAADIKAIIKAQRLNKFALTTKCNSYHRMIDEATTKESVMSIIWGSNLSEEKQKAYDSIVSNFSPQ